MVLERKSTSFSPQLKTPKSNGNVRFQPEVSREFAFLAVLP